MTVPDPSQKCPQCGEPVLAERRFPTWCPACEWGVAPAGQVQEKRRGRFASWVDRWSARQVAAMFGQVSRAGARRPGWDLARVASYGLAICILAIPVGLIALAIWLIFGIASIPSIVLGIIVLPIIVELRPRLGSLRKVKHLRRRNDAPALFTLLDAVAAEAGAKPAYAVITTADWNAAYGAVGWRRRRVVTLGLPLWDALAADQKVAVLGHEFGHGVNGDARHGLIVGTSLGTLARLRWLLLPGRMAARARMSFIDGLARLASTVLCLLVTGVYDLQHLISLHASQRAEYLADAIGARLASPASMAAALDTIVTGRATQSWAVGRRRFGDRKTTVWDDISAALAALPEGEKERRRRELARERFSVTATHPPAHLRIKVMQGLPAAEARVTLTTTQEAQIQEELAKNYARVGAAVDEAVR